MSDSSGGVLADAGTALEEVEALAADVTAIIAGSRSET